jgi:hypothetical protein
MWPALSPLGSLTLMIEHALSAQRSALAGSRELRARTARVVSRSGSINRAKRRPRTGPAR